MSLYNFFVKALDIQRRCKKERNRFDEKNLVAQQKIPFTKNCIDFTKKLQLFNFAVNGVGAILVSFG